MTVILAGIFSACNKYLDVPPQGQIDQEAAGKDPEAADKLVLGAYNTLWESNVHGFSYIGMTNIASDDADKGSNPDDGRFTLGTLDDLTMNSNLSQLNEIWKGYYIAITRANLALAALSTSPLDDAKKNRLTGEARFLRAYCYFNLVRFFGGVPLVDKVLTPQESLTEKYQTKATPEQIYALIQSDLEFALANLPVKGATGTNVGRANKGAAAGLLAKVSLYLQNWQRAFSLSDSIITQKVGDYGLLPNYVDIWRETGANGRESIFEVETGVNSLCEAAIPNYAECQAPRAGGKFGWADLGWGFSTPSQSLVDEYEPGDKRLNATVIFITTKGTVLWDGFRVPSRDSVENDRYNYKSYHSQTREKNCGRRDRLPKNLRILRYGEILLIHAEAALALGNGGAAVSDISDLRVRAGLLPVGTVTREDIWHERRVELAMEHDRFFDIVRQDKVMPGRAEAAFRKHGKTYVRAKNEVFPIPQQQIDFSQGKLKQNSGY